MSLPQPDKAAQLIAEAEALLEKAREARESIAATRRMLVEAGVDVNDMQGLRVRAERQLADAGAGSLDDFVAQSMQRIERSALADSAKSAPPSMSRRKPRPMV